MAASIAVKILLTGASGFIGNAFLNTALQAGHELGALIRPESSVDIRAINNENCHWLRGSLAEPPLRQIEQFTPEICVHTAWISTPGVYLESPENYKFVDWSFEFIKRLRQIGLRHFVVLGTCIEYAMQGKILSEENSQIEPKTTYARCKNELRIKLEEWLSKNDSSLCWARVFYPYGIGEHPARLCTSLIRKVQSGQKTVLKTPDSIKDYIYIDDLVAALLRVVEGHLTGAVNLGTGSGVSIGAIAEIIGNLFKRPDLIERASEQVYDPMDFVVADASKLRSLGWIPRVGLRNGIDQLVNSLTI